MSREMALVLCTCSVQKCSACILAARGFVANVYGTKFKKLLFVTWSAGCRRLHHLRGHSDAILTQPLDRSPRTGLVTLSVSHLMLVPSPSVSYIKEHQWWTAQIRIVDASSSRWAHINVDDFRFSWHKGSGSTPATNYVPKQHESNFGPGTGGCGQGQCGAHEGSDAGAAYVFRRRDKYKSVTTGVVRRYEPCQKWCNQFGC